MPPGRVDVRRRAGHPLSRTPEQRREDTIVASAARVGGKRRPTDGPGSARKATREQDWYREAWEHVDSNGELGYVVDQTARQASKARMRVMRQPVLAGDDPVALDATNSDHQIAMSIINAIGGGAAGMAMLLDRIVGHLSVTGDSYLVGCPGPGELGAERRRGDPPRPKIDDTDFGAMSWQALAPGEIVVLDDRSYDVDLGTGKVHYAKDELFAVRVWRKHRRQSALATSPVLRNLPVLRELKALTADIASVIESRLPLGLLLIPQEGTFPTNPEDDAEGTSGFDLFMSELAEAFVAAREGLGTAEALVPPMAQVPGETIAQWRFITFAKDFIQDMQSLRDEAITRLAIGLDAPPSIMRGLDDSTSWSSWTITHDYVESHVLPMLVLVADALTTGVLQPALMAAGVADFDQYLVWPDVVDLVSSPAREDAAISAYDRLLIDAEAARRELGFDEGDAPTNAEQVAQMLRLVGRIPAGALEVAPLLLRSMGEDALANDLERLAAFFGGVTGEDVLLQSGTSGESDPRRAGSDPMVDPATGAPDAVPGTRPEGRPANDPGAPARMSRNPFGVEPYQPGSP